MTAWLSLLEAAELLEKRNQSPKEAILRMLRESGLAGNGRVWSAPNAPPVRRTLINTWLEHPHIDIGAGTILIPSRAPGRRLPDDFAATLLMNREEIDRRWPTQAKTGGRTTTQERGEKECADWLRSQTASGVIWKRDPWLEEAGAKFPNISGRGLLRAWEAGASTAQKAAGRPRVETAKALKARAK